MVFNAFQQTCSHTGLENITFQYYFMIWSGRNISTLLLVGHHHVMKAYKVVFCEYYLTDKQMQLINDAVDSCVKKIFTIDEKYPKITKEKGTFYFFAYWKCLLQYKGFKAHSWNYYSVLTLLIYILHRNQK